MGKRRSADNDEHNQPANENTGHNLGDALEKRRGEDPCVEKKYRELDDEDGEKPEDLMSEQDLLDALAKSSKRLVMHCKVPIRSNCR